MSDLESLKSTLLSQIDGAEQDVLPPRLHGDALLLPQHPHQRGAREVAVAVPALDDAVRLLDREHAGDVRVDLV